MAGDGRVCVALDVCAPLPASGIGVASSNKLGLQALEFLLGTKLVGLSQVRLVCRKFGRDRDLP